MSDTFEFSGLFSPAVEREFFPQDDMKPGTGLMLWLNLDLLTLEFMERLEADFNKLITDASGFLEEVTAVDPPPAKKSRSTKLAVAAVKSEPTPTIPKIELFVFEKARFRFFARALAGEQGKDDPALRLIRDWSLVRDGVKVPIEYETFVQMPPHGLAKLYRFVVGEASNPTASEKKRSKAT